MIMVKKKDGSLDKFNVQKILHAVYKSLSEVGDQDAEGNAYKIALKVAAEVTLRVEHAEDDVIDYNDIHNKVELSLMDHNKAAAKAYILYRQNHKEKRAGKDALMEAIRATTKEISKDNANIRNSPSSKMYEIGSLANKFFVLDEKLPKHIADAHRSGRIHIHDINYYTLTYNCLNYDLGALLARGFRMPHGWIRRPKSIMAAAALAAVSLQSVQNDQYGGVSIDSIDTALKEFITDETTDRQIYQAMESLLFNLNSLHSRAGNQIPFSSISLGIDTDPRARRICKAILEAYRSGLGKGEPMMFPQYRGLSIAI